MPRAPDPEWTPPLLGNRVPYSKWYRPFEPRNIQENRRKAQSQPEAEAAAEQAWGTERFEYKPKVDYKPKADSQAWYIIGCPKYTDLDELIKDIPPSVHSHFLYERLFFVQISFILEISRGKAYDMGKNEERKRQKVNKEHGLYYLLLASNHTI